MGTQEFNAGYRYSEIYERVLPPHFYGGKEDVELVRDYLSVQIGSPPETGQREVLDLGCGPGRLTTVLEPYAAKLLATDKSEAMVSAVRHRFPGASTRCADTESVVHALHDEGRSGSFDLIGAFWSMSYPMLECFEETTADGVVMTAEPGEGRARACC